MFRVLAGRCCHERRSTRHGMWGDTLLAIGKQVCSLEWVVAAAVQAADVVAAAVAALVVARQRLVPRLDNRMACRFAGGGLLVVAPAVAGGKSAIQAGLMA